jgi:hypothetical protein
MRNTFERLTALIERITHPPGNNVVVLTGLPLHFFLRSPGALNASLGPRSVSLKPIHLLLGSGLGPLGCLNCLAVLTAAATFASSEIASARLASDSPRAWTNEPPVVAAGLDNLPQVADGSFEAAHQTKRQFLGVMVGHWRSPHATRYFSAANNVLDLPLADVGQDSTPDDISLADAVECGDHLDVGLQRRPAQEAHWLRARLYVFHFHFRLRFKQKARRMTASLELISRTLGSN